LQTDNALSVEIIAEKKRDESLFQRFSRKAPRNRKAHSLLGDVKQLIPQKQLHKNAQHTRGRNKSSNTSQAVRPQNIKSSSKFVSARRALSNYILRKLVHYRVPNECMRFCSGTLGPRRFAVIFSAAALYSLWLLDFDRSLVDAPPH
jgi:hypothetical protein